MLLEAVVVDQGTGILVYRQAIFGYFVAKVAIDSDIGLDRKPKTQNLINHTFI